MKPSPVLALPLALLFAAPLSAQEDQRRYTIDPAASAVEAKVAFLAVASKTARFPDMKGALRFSVGNYEAVDMTVEVDARTLAGGGASDTRMLRGKQFFDAAHYPTVRFVAERMELTGARSAKVTGRMTARGVTQPVTLAIVFSLDPMQTDGTEPLSIVGTTTIDRRRFGMTAFPLVVGNQVKITIRARMVPG